MKKYLSVAILLIAVGLVSGFVLLPEKVEKTSNVKTFYDFKVKTLDGKDFDMASLKGKKVLVVNTASKCGFTPQYEVLEKLYESLDKSKFAIIGFPANNFKSQEPGTASEIKEFCTKNYGVTFPMMEKVSVCDYNYKSFPPDPNNADKTTTSDIYKWLTKKELNGVMDVNMEWNFQKFLIDENGHLMGVIPPKFGKELLLMQEWLQ